MYILSRSEHGIPFPCFSSIRQLGIVFFPMGNWQEQDFLCCHSICSIIMSQCRGLTKFVFS